MSDEDLIRDYQADQRRRGHIDRSVRHRGCSLHAFSRFLDDRRLFDAAKADVDTWLDERGVGAKTRYWHVCNLACFYQWAILEGHTDADPTARLHRPRLPRQLPRPMDQDDLRIAVEKADPRMKAWLLLAAFEGLRAMEIAGLDRSHILDSTDPPLLIVMGKGGHQRTVPLHPEVLAALRVFGLPARGWLWANRKGNHISAAHVSRVIADYLRSLSIEATGHQGRHYFGSRIYALSHDLRLTQELMGHADPRTTAIYAAWDQSHAGDVVVQLSV